MTELLIAAIVCVIVGTIDLIHKKQRARAYKASNKGSRTVELEEWDRWSTQLTEQYNDITGLTLPYPEIKFSSENLAGAYYNAFSGHCTPSPENKWKDSRAIEALRLRHNLPSDDELYAMEEWMYSKKIVLRPTHYTSLAYVIQQCVYRSVNERCYKYGGTDWEDREAVRMKWIEIASKHSWLENDPTNQDS